MIDLRMWARALRVIPRVSKPEWDALDPVSKWLLATRAAVFVMTFVSAAIGGLLAVRDDLFSAPRFLACLIGLVFAHATNNLVNDLTDHLKGVDKDNYFRAQYGPQPLEHGLLTIRQVIGYAAFSGAVALAAGLYLVLTTGGTTLNLLAAGIFFVLFYTWPLKWFGLGEPAVLLVWGPLMVGGTYYVVTGGHYDPSVTWISLAYALGPTAVLFGKHTDKLKADRAKGIRTLPVLLGEPASRLSVLAMLFAQMALTIGLVARGQLGWPLLVVLFALPSLRHTIPVFLRPRPDVRPPRFPEHIWPTYLVAYAFRYNRVFGLLFILGMLADLLLHHR
jgi:1,4-dihydroxy-2-naphthoate octaprenyltransferase